jgi:hypothetical protein
VAKKRAPIREDQLRNWNLLDQFRQRVLPLLEAQPARPTEEDERPTLFAEDYFCSYWTGLVTEEDLMTLLQGTGCKKKS